MLFRSAWCVAIACFLAAAVARQREGESAAQLTAEGQALYEGDAVKRTPIQYGMGGAPQADSGNFREAIRTASRALYLGTSQKNESLVAIAKKDIALSYLYAGNLDAAQRYASEVLKHSVNFQYKSYAHGGAHKILGDIALRRGDPAAAIKSYDEAIDQAFESQRFFSRAALASAYIAARQYDKADAAIEKAESFVEIGRAHV